VVDDVTGQVEREDRYYIEISALDGSDVLRSAADFEWDDAVERASWFKEATWTEATNRWKRAGMSERSDET
jgi:hypothetical protein